MTHQPDSGEPVAVILVIEDEPGIRDFLERGLHLLGFDVRCAEDGEQGLAAARSREIQLVVLDLRLPKLSGDEILSIIRRDRPGLPVIVLTARDSLQDKIAGLQAGAIDYMTKPFAIDELGARIHAQLRSARRSDTVLQKGDITVDFISRAVSVADQDIRLSSTEFEVLVFLLRHSGQVLSRTKILAEVWGYSHDPTTNVVDVYIGYLRRKLDDAGARSLITTVRGIGYRFDLASS